MFGWFRRWRKSRNASAPVAASSPPRADATAQRFADDVDASAPGRTRLEVQQKELSDGRVLEYLIEERGHLLPTGRYESLGIARPPATGCGCTPTSITDVYSCTSCSDVVCSGHIATCSRDGRNHCSACLELVIHHGVAVLVCRDCARVMRGGLLRRLWRVMCR